jgi:hypothetical protein
MSYINTPEAFPRGGGGETRNHETKDVPAKIGEGNVAEVSPGRFFNSPTSPTPPP